MNTLVLVYGLLLRLNFNNLIFVYSQENLSCNDKRSNEQNEGGEEIRERQRERESLLFSKGISFLGFEVTAKTESQAHSHESPLQNALYCFCGACDKLQKDFLLLHFFQWVWVLFKVLQNEVMQSAPNAYASVLGSLNG